MRIFHFSAKTSDPPWMNSNELAEQNKITINLFDKTLHEALQKLFHYHIEVGIDN